MKSIDSKFHLIACMVLAGFSAFQLAHADQSEMSFEQETQLTESELSAQSGQGGVQQNVTSYTTVTNNTINGSVVTGNNVLNQQAFSGASGIATVIQNTGNHVAISNHVTVNLTLK